MSGLRLRGVRRSRIIGIFIFGGSRSMMLMGHGVLRIIGLLFGVVSSFFFFSCGVLRG